MDGYAAVGNLLKACAHPVRLQILEVLLRDREACVCHLEAQLGQRQAAISQHLARLRQAGLVTDQRHGLNVYYSVSEPAIRPLLAAARRTAGAVAGDSGRLTFDLPKRRPGHACPCPRCAEAAPVVAAGVRAAQG